MFVTTFCSNYTKSNKVAITFDDGPDAIKTPKILEILSKYNAKATFFCIGEKIENNRSIAEQIVSEGHLIGNHSYSHSTWFSLLSSKKIVREIEKTQALIKSITNKDNVFFRPPYGVTNPLIHCALTHFNLKSIGWSIRSLDTKNESASVVLSRITKNVKGGDVLLLHDTSTNILEILSELLPFLSDNNLTPVTIDELIFNNFETTL